ncbi:MAG: DsrE family protein [Promethearchaeota archaeon]
MESVLIICDKAPFGTNLANEAIRLGAGFLALGEDIDCKLVLIDDGILFLKKNLNADLIGVEPISEGLEMADLSDLEIIVFKEDMDKFGLTEDDFIDYSNLAIRSKSEFSSIIAEFDGVFKI